MKTLGIIGGSGFIGSHVTRKFLREGYDVKVGVTDIKNSKKYRHLFHFDDADNLTISELRVENREALGEFLKNCEIVVHAGTPFKLDVKDPEAELFAPTVKGTENFLEAIGRAAELEKVVLVASVAGWNTNFPLPPDGVDPADPIDESGERFISIDSHPYAQAKYLANQAVMRYIRENPRVGFEITTVSPVMVLGKSLSDREDSTSTGMQYLIKNKLATNDFIKSFFDNDVTFAIVDVVDVAEAIFKAATTKGIHGRDYLLSSETYRVSDVHAMLNGRPSRGGPMTVYKNDLARAELNMRFRPVEETLNGYGQKTDDKIG